jgi:serine/threonine-protein kinase RsbW
MAAGSISVHMGSKKSLSVPGRYDQIRRLCAFVGDGARQAGFNEDSIFQVELACDEACTNIIEHTYEGEGVGEIQVTWQYNSDFFTVIIRDHGPRFDPSGIPSPSVPPKLDDVEELPVGGLGVFFMRRLMDKISFDYHQGKGNVLTMVKRRSQDEEVK